MSISVLHCIRHHASTSKRWLSYVADSVPGPRFDSYNRVSTPRFVVQKRFSAILHWLRTFENDISGKAQRLHGRSVQTFSCCENIWKLITCCVHVSWCFVVQCVSFFGHIARECVLGSFYGIRFVRQSIGLDWNFGLNVGINACCLFVMICTRQNKTYDDWFIGGGKNSS